jgi:hypothetical protein
MKASEFKLRFITTINNLIDTYFGSNTMVDKFVNSTLHVMVKQKSYMLRNKLGANTIDEAIRIFEEKYYKL